MQIGIKGIKNLIITMVLKKTLKRQIQKDTFPSLFMNFFQTLIF